MVTKILIGWSFEPVLSSKAAAIAAAETAAATICNPSPVGGNDEHLAGVVVVVGVVAGVDRDTAVGCSVWVVVNIPFGRLKEWTMDDVNHHCSFSKRSVSSTPRFRKAQH